MSILLPIDSSLKFTKNDPNDQRLGETLCRDVKTAQYHIIGYPDDEGIKNNGGRIGASQGPDSIRRYLYKMTQPQCEPRIYDHGNLNTASFSLENRHQQLIEYLDKVKPQKWIGLGGGHDYAFVDGSHFLNKQFSTKPLIINIDAHLDVRPDDRGINSGTPFYRLKKQYKEQFDMIQVGIQPQCNSLHHLNWCNQNNIEVLTIEELRSSQISLSELFVKRFSKHIISHRACFLSVDIDGFSSTLAPGCSQSWPAGLEYNESLEFMELLQKRLDVQCLGVYEVSPPLDFDNITSRLASLLIYNFIKYV